MVSDQNHFHLLCHRVKRYGHNLQPDQTNIIAVNKLVQVGAYLKSARNQQIDGRSYYGHDFESDNYNHRPSAGAGSNCKVPGYVQYKLINTRKYHLNNLSTFNMLFQEQSHRIFSQYHRTLMHCPNDQTLHRHHNCHHMRVCVYSVHSRIPFAQLPPSDPPLVWITIHNWMAASVCVSQCSRQSVGSRGSVRIPATSAFVCRKCRRNCTLVCNRPTVWTIFGNGNG